MIKANVVLSVSFDGHLRLFNKIDMRLLVLVPVDFSIAMFVLVLPL